MAHKTHRAKIDPIGVYPFSGPIAGASRENPKAHGNVTIVEECSCGAQRYVNVNTLERETGPWELRTGVARSAPA